jgi:hypothetical protein
MRREPGWRGALSVDHICTLAWLLGEKTVECFQRGERCVGADLEPPVPAGAPTAIDEVVSAVLVRHGEAVRRHASPLERALLNDLLEILVKWGEVTVRPPPGLGDEVGPASPSPVWEQAGRRSPASAEPDLGRDMRERVALEAISDLAKRATAEGMAPATLLGTIGDVVDAWRARR